MFVQKVLQGPFSFTNDDGHTYVLCRPCKVIATGNARFKRHFDMELKRDGEAVKLPGGAVWAMATVVKAGVKEKESDCTSISSNSHFEIQSGVWATCALPPPRRRRDCGHSPPEKGEPWMRMLREEMDRYTTAVKGKRRGVGKGESVAFVFDASDPKIGSILVKKVRVSAKVPRAPPLRELDKGCSGRPAVVASILAGTTLQANSVRIGKRVRMPPVKYWMNERKHRTRE